MLPGIILLVLGLDFPKGGDTFNNDSYLTTGTVLCADVALSVFMEAGWGSQKGWKYLGLRHWAFEGAETGLEPTGKSSSELALANFWVLSLDAMSCWNASQSDHVIPGTFASSDLFCICTSNSAWHTAARQMFQWRSVPVPRCTAAKLLFLVKFSVQSWPDQEESCSCL